jgi:hypothetical protein
VGWARSDLRCDRRRARVALTIDETVRHWEQLKGGGVVAVVFGCAFMTAIVGAAGVIVGLVVFGVIRWAAARVSRLLVPSPPRRGA